MYYEYRDNQKEKTMLLIHSFPSSMILFNKHIPILEEKYNILLIDLPGFGKSKQENVFDIDKVVNEIADILKSLNVNNLDVWGVSLGGIIAAHLNNTVEINNLILESTPINNQNIETREINILNKFHKLLQKTKTESIFNNMLDKNKLVRSSIIKAYEIVKSKHSDAQLNKEFLHECAKNLNLKSFFMVFGYLQNFDITKLLKNSKNKTLYIFSEGDIVVKPSISLPIIKKEIPDVILKGYDYDFHAPSAFKGDIISKDILNLIQ